MKIGDEVKVIEPYNGFACKIHGVVWAFYNSDRAIIMTKTGNTWALKKSELKVLRKL